MQLWEIGWFNKLGNEIMLQLIDKVDPTDLEKLKLLGDDTPEKRSERLKKAKDNTKTRMSSIAYGDYAGNPVSLVLRLACSTITGILSRKPNLLFLSL